MWSITTFSDGTFTGFSSKPSASKSQNSLEVRIPLQPRRRYIILPLHQHEVVPAAQTGLVLNRSPVYQRQKLPQRFHGRAIKGLQLLSATGGANRSPTVGKLHARWKHLVGLRLFQLRTLLSYLQKKLIYPWISVGMRCTASLNRCTSAFCRNIVCLISLFLQQRRVLSLPLRQIRWSHLRLNVETLTSHPGWRTFQLVVVLVGRR